jgi:hypothetical protein
MTALGGKLALSLTKRLLVGQLGGPYSLIKDLLRRSYRLIIGGPRHPYGIFVKLFCRFYGWILSSGALKSRFEFILQFVDVRLENPLPS